MSETNLLLIPEDEVPDLHEIAETRFLTIGSISYAYRDFGNENAIPIIFFQHFGGNMDDWDPYVTNGLAKYFRIIIWDNRGIGATTGETPDYISDMADDAISFIHGLGLAKVHIFGFSMGGFVAQEIALKEPQLIDKIILAGTGPQGSKGLGQIEHVLGEAFTERYADPRLFTFFRNSPASQKLGKESLERINRRTTERSPTTTAINVAAQLRSILNWSLAIPEYPEMLGKINHSVIVVNGNDDNMVPTINSYDLFQMLPNAYLKLYPDSGHGAIFQYPELFLQDALYFLSPDLFS